MRGPAPPTPAPRSRRASSRQIAQAQAAVDKARLDLSRTEDPRADGRRDRECRQAPGRPDGGDRASACCRWSTAARAWVEANFKEKDVGRMVPGQQADDRGRRLSRPEVRGACRRASAPAPAANSRCFRRRTPTAIGSRSRSACRCGSRSTASRRKPMIAGLSVDATVYFDKQEVGRRGRHAGTSRQRIRCRPASG